jgi:hypothetical protein
MKNLRKQPPQHQKNPRRKRLLREATEARPLTAVKFDSLLKKKSRIDDENKDDV